MLVLAFISISLMNLLVRSIEHIFSTDLSVNLQADNVNFNNDDEFSIAESIPIAPSSIIGFSLKFNSSKAQFAKIDASIIAPSDPKMYIYTTKEF